MWCVYKFLNVEVTNGVDIMSNSSIDLSVGEVATL